MKAIILGARKGVRSVDSARSYPATLMRDDAGGALIDWALGALDKAGVDEVAYIGGYHIEKVVEQYPCLKYYYHSDWMTEGESGALACALGEMNGACLIVSEGVVFRPFALRALQDVKAPASLGLVPGEDSRGCPDGRVGLALLSGEASQRLAAFLENSPHDLDLRQCLEGAGEHCSEVELGDLVAHVETPADLSSFVFGSKAQTLERVSTVLKSAVVLDQVRFSVRQWEQAPQTVFQRIRDAFADGDVIIRSSALCEDMHSCSMAGQFKSVPGVRSGSQEDVAAAVAEVIESYSHAPDPDNEVFVQPYLRQVVNSGVAFTRDSESLGPYLIINYDRESATADSVTSGNGDGQRSVIVRKGTSPEAVSDPHVRRLLDVCAELERLMGNDALDMEFAFNADGQCYLLQVRPLVGNRTGERINDEDFDAELSMLKANLAAAIDRQAYVPGKRSVFANMPDWNPAELVGVCPRPLGLTLFQHLITERAWAEARKRIGYADMTLTPLVVAFAGHPYVDTRISFNSMIPAVLPEDLRERLVDYYVDVLLGHPEWHDKVEFHVLITCLDLSFDAKSRRLLDAGFTAGEVETFRSALRDMTEDIVQGNVCPVDEMLGLVRKLEHARAAVKAFPREDPAALSRNVHLLLEDCRECGTVPFSILARYAFIAMTFLVSLEDRGIFSTEETARIKQSIPSVASRISHDLLRLERGDMSREEFLELYGHLRPGTYDINSPSYAEGADLYLGAPKAGNTDDGHEESVQGMEIFARRGDAINAALAESGFSFGWRELAAFIMSVIPAREEAKFEYSKNISLVLDLLGRLGQGVGLSKDEMSYVSIQQILEMGTCGTRYFWDTDIRRSVNKARKVYNLHRAIRLPHMIAREDDVDAFELLKWRPNFITDKQVMSPVAWIQGAKVDGDLEGRLVVIESADPGYDWLFGRGIAGLITKYGGVASHMAIRAAELDLPAAIGCGDLIYESLRGGAIVFLDCAAQIVRKVK